MRQAQASALSILFLLAGCPTNDENDAGFIADGGTSVVFDAGNSSAAGSGSVPSDDGGYTLVCEHGGAIGKIHVEFRCDEIIVYSCKDISNVVLEFEDGSRQRYQNGYDQIETFSGSGANAGKRIVGVWVKAGNNKSGDGPGYGERFDAPGIPGESCNETDGGAGSGGSAGNGGSAGTGSEDPCADNDPDTLCGDEGLPDDPDDDYCASHPFEPSCVAE